MNERVIGRREGLGQSTPWRIGQVSTACAAKKNPHAEWLLVDASASCRKTQWEDPSL